MRALKKKLIQIYIEPRQELALESLSKKRRISKAALVRISLDRYLSALPMDEDQALGIIGMGMSGKNDISERHDAYLAEYGSAHTKKVQTL